MDRTHRATECPRRRVHAALFVMAAATALSLAAPGRARAQLIGISLTRNNDLAFGQMFAGGVAGTCVVSPAGARSATGGVLLGSSTGVGAANFTVAGQLLSTYSVTLPASVSLTSGASSMTVNTFTSTPSGTGQLNVLGMQTLTVGATLQVGASQTPGSYGGSFNVTVAYN